MVRLVLQSARKQHIASMNATPQAGGYTWDEMMSESRSALALAWTTNLLQ